MILAKLLLPIAVLSQNAGTTTNTPLIPDRFHGIWDDVASDCSTNSDARLRITAGEMVFYESVAKVTSVRQDNEGALISVLASGEGEVFETTYRLYVKDGRLFMEVAGTNYGAFERKRCPQ